MLTRMRMRVSEWISVGLFLAAVGCGSKSNIGLSGSVQSLEARVEQVALGAALEGRLVLFLEVGAQASASSEVGLEAMALIDAETEALLLSPLHAAPEQVSFPLQLEPGASTTVTFSLDEQPLLTSAEGESLCQAPVQALLTLSDSLNGGQTLRIVSPPISVECIP